MSIVLIKNKAKNIEHDEKNRGARNKLRIYICIDDENIFESRVCFGEGSLKKPKI